MKNNFTTLAAFGALAILLWSQCSPRLYVHNTLNTPLPAQKGDFQASISTIGSYLDINGSNAELQGSYALGNRIAVMGNLLWMDWLRGDGNFTGRHRLFELGAGHYSTFWKNDLEPPLGRASIMAGLGLGSGRDNLPGATRDIRFDYQGNYQRYFVQPALGIRMSIVDASLALRASYVHYSRYQQTQVNGPVIENSRLEFATLEPAFSISVGYKYVKFFSQTRLTYVLANESDWLKVTNAIDNLDLTPTVGIMLSSWRNPLKQHPSVVVQKSNKSSGERPAAQEAPNILLPVSGPTISICVRDADSFDDDVIHLSFNGAYLLKDAVLTRKFNCLEMSLQPDTENVLRIHGASEGRTPPITIELTIRDGKKERRQYLRINAGQTSEIRLAPQ